MIVIKSGEPYAGDELQHTIILDKKYHDPWDRARRLAIQNTVGVVTGVRSCIVPLERGKLTFTIRGDVDDDTHRRILRAILVALKKHGLHSGSTNPAIKSLRTST